LAQGTTIYIVDDDEAVRDSVRALLECEDYSVAAFATGADFLRAAPSDRGGCLVLDVDMPVMSGIELSKRLRALGFAMPMIFMTARAEQDVRYAAQQAGATLLLKPFLGNELLETVKRRLGACPAR
jgi:two-component system, LuxR family, response regulator FixJ